MSRKATPELIFEIYRDKVLGDLEAGNIPEGLLWTPPLTWEEVPEQEKALFAAMARGMNSIAGEFDIHFPSS